jgi:Paraquat-inducible protein A
MKKLYSLPGIVLSVIFLLVSYTFITKSVEESNKFKDDKNEVAEILNFNDRLLSARDWVFSETTWQEKKLKFEASLQKADEHYGNAQTFGNYMLFGCLGFFVIIVLLYARKRMYFGITLGLSVIAIALLGQGIMNPILEMSAFKEDLTVKVYVKPKDIPYFKEAMAYLDKIADFTDNIRIVPYYGETLAEGAKDLVTDGQDYLRENANTDYGMDKVFEGRTYFYYQNKSIMDVISLLWDNNNKPVAMAIGTFSVVIPLFKLLMTLLILILPITGLRRFRKFLSYISKWSMADVFVVGAFLSYLSFANLSPGVDMEANVLFGLYYFGGYVIISIFLGIFLDKSIQEKIDLTDMDTNVVSLNSSDDDDISQKIT